MQETERRRRILHYGRMDARNAVRIDLDAHRRGQAGNGELHVATRQAEPDQARNARENCQEQDRETGGQAGENTNGAMHPAHVAMPARGGNWHGAELQARAR